MGTVHAEVSAVLSEPQPWRNRESVTSFFEDYEFMKQVIPDPRAVGSPSRRFFQAEVAPEDKALYTQVLLTNSELYDEVYKKTKDHKTLLVMRSKKKAGSAGSQKKSKKKKSKRDLQEKSRGKAAEDVEEPGVPAAAAELDESEEDESLEPTTPLLPSLEWGDIRAALVTPKSSVPLVKVLVQRASNLKLGFGGPPQPFVLVEIGNRRAFTLTAIHSLLNPKWFEEFTFELRSDTETLDFSVIDQNPQCKGVVLGYASIDVLNLAFRSPKDFEIELRPKEGTPERDIPWVGGTLTVTIEVTLDVGRRGIESYANVRQFFDERKSRNLGKVRDMNAIKELRENERKEKELRLSYLMKLSQGSGSGKDLSIVVPDDNGTVEPVDDSAQGGTSERGLSTNEKKLVNAFKLLTADPEATPDIATVEPGTDPEEIMNLTEKMLAAVERQGSRFKAASALMLEREKALENLSDLVNMKQNGLNVDVNPKILETTISPTARIRAMAMMSRMSSNFVKKREENGRPTMYAFLDKDGIGGENFGLNHTPSKKKIHRVAPFSSPKKSPAKSNSTASPVHERGSAEFMSEGGSPIREDNTVTTIGSESKGYKKKRRHSPRRSPYKDSSSVQISPVLSKPSLAELSGASLGNKTEKKSPGSPKRKNGVKRKAKRGLATTLFSPEGNSQTRSLIVGTSLDLLFDPKQQYSGISLPADETGHRPNIKGGKLDPIAPMSHIQPKGVRFTVRGIMKKHEYPPPAPSSLSVANEIRSETRVPKNIVSQSQYMLQTFQEIVRERSAIMVQRIWKGYLTRLWYRYVIYQVIKCQSLVRGMQARRRNANFKRSTLLLTKKSFVDEALKALGAEGRSTNTTKPLSRSGSRSGLAAMFGVEEGTVIHGTSTPRTRRKTTSEEKEKSLDEQDLNDSEDNVEGDILKSRNLPLKDLDPQLPGAVGELALESGRRDSDGDEESSAIVDSMEPKQDENVSVMPQSNDEANRTEAEKNETMLGEVTTVLDSQDPSENEPNTAEASQTVATIDGTSEALAELDNGDHEGSTAQSDHGVEGMPKSVRDEAVGAVVNPEMSPQGDQSTHIIPGDGSVQEHELTGADLVKIEGPHEDRSREKTAEPQPKRTEWEVPERSPDIVPIDPPFSEEKTDVHVHPPRKPSEELLFMDQGSEVGGAVDLHGDPLPNRDSENTEGLTTEEANSGSKSPLSFIKVNGLAKSLKDTNEQDTSDAAIDDASPPKRASPNWSPVTVSADGIPTAKKKKKNSLEIVPLENRQLDVLESPKRPRRRLRSMRLKSGEFSADDLPNHPISILSPKPQDETGPGFPKWPPPAMENDPDDESYSRFSLYDLPMGEVMDDSEGDSDDGDFVPGETIKYRPFYTDSPDKTFEEEMKQSFGTNEDELGPVAVPNEEEEMDEEDQYTELSTVKEEDEDQYLSDFDGDSDIAEMQKQRKGEAKGHHRKSSSVSDADSRGHRKSMSQDRSGGSNSDGRADEVRVEARAVNSSVDRDGALGNDDDMKTHNEVEGESKAVAMTSMEEPNVLPGDHEMERPQPHGVLERTFSKELTGSSDDMKQDENNQRVTTEKNKMGELNQEEPSAVDGDTNDDHQDETISTKDAPDVVEAAAPTVESFVPIPHSSNKSIGSSSSSSSPSSSGTAATTSSEGSGKEDVVADAKQAGRSPDDTADDSSSANDSGSDSSDPESEPPQPTTDAENGPPGEKDAADPPAALGMATQAAAGLPGGTEEEQGPDDEFEYFSDDFED